MTAIKSKYLDPLILNLALGRLSTSQSPVFNRVAIEIQSIYDLLPISYSEHCFREVVILKPPIHDLRDLRYTIGRIGDAKLALVSKSGFKELADSGGMCHKTGYIDMIAGFPHVVWSLVVPYPLILILC